ncbi:protein argonaute 4A-like [Quercus lobata]|uniref:Argonaute 4 n=1 Tax=Quercus lobata TaxID=97700 RepID=A0A7N2LFM0_QUELO|nr:protein argonaute 4A-like [Quercus lobata]
MASPEGNDKLDSLPPPPPVVPPNVIPIIAEPAKVSEPLKKTSTPKRLPMARRDYGNKGQRLSLLTNHFKVDVPKIAGCFYHYSVALSYEDGHPVDAKGIGRKVIDKAKEVYDNEFRGKEFAYDGENSLFTFGPLAQNKLELLVVLDTPSSNRASRRGSPGDDESDRKRSRRPFQSKTYKVQISYAAKIPMQAILDALHGQESDRFQEAVRVLDIILRQNAAKQGCLLVRQSFFHGNERSFINLDGGVLGCRGFHSSFRATEGGLSLNMDVSTTMIVQPGPVMDFLTSNQKSDRDRIDWIKAKKTLKNLRIRVNNNEYKITGLSDQICKDQKFSLKQRKANGETEVVETTVYDYFVNHKQIYLPNSAYYPCINVGKPKQPTYFPIELCTLVPLQRYTKALSGQQRASLVEKSRQKPKERMDSLRDAFITSRYNDDQMLHSSRISISSEFTQVEGRVLPAPRLTTGNGEEFLPRNGRWNFNNKKFVNPVKIENWAVVNFSARCDILRLVRDLRKIGEAKGLSISQPRGEFHESPQDRNASAPVRVGRMIEMIGSKLKQKPEFFLCVLPERKNSEIYGPWKRRNLVLCGIVTQCIAPTRLNDQYITNVLLKINAKLGGLNSLLTIERSNSLPLISEIPTLILGMDVSHGSPGRSDMPSVAAVVGSRDWPQISRYRASVCTQSPKVEMIDSLFKPVHKTNENGITRVVDEGIFRELLMDFYESSNRKPQQIIIFRDGVSESQFNQVLNIELDQIIEACKLQEESWHPKFTVIVAQKNHHTRFFQTRGATENVPPGTVIDSKVCHPRNNDFYLCAHAGMIGTSRPTHYHLLYDEIGFSANDLQELVHSLSYVYQRSTSAISIVAPIMYAHLAASQVTQFIKFDDISDRSSSGGGVTSSGAVPVPELPKLNDAVKSSMFFC